MMVVTWFFLTPFRMASHHVRPPRRETILLKLLVIPNDDLKLIVMLCLSKVPLSAWAIIGELQPLIMERTCAHTSYVHSGINK
jgi:hypothetical protein